MSQCPLYASTHSLYFIYIFTLRPQLFEFFLLLLNIFLGLLCDENKETIVYGVYKCRMRNNIMEQT